MGEKNPGRVESLFRALHQIVPSHLLDGTAFNFKNLDSAEALLGFQPEIDGDRAFDESASEVTAEAMVTLGTYTASL